MRLLGHPDDRRVLRMGAQALGALAVEPLYVLVDTAIVGRLGTSQLAGLALAASVLLLVVAGSNFLAYGTTPRVARARGAGREDLAAHTGAQALWLAALIGLPLAALLALLARPAATLLGGEGEALDAAVTYLRISAVGVPFVLLALVGQGVLRGWADLRTPLVILVVANVANVVVELVLVFGLDLGIAGSAWSTALAQVGAGLWFLGAMAPRLRRAPTRRPEGTELAALVGAGRHLVVRVASLLVVLTAATAVAARVDEPTLAAHVVAAQMFTFLALVLDALAIPAQTLVAELRGLGDPAGALRMGARVERLSLLAGTALAVVLLPLAPLLPHLFTDDPAVTSRAAAALVVLALALPPAGIAFGLDGVLIGAEDLRHLSRIMALSALAFAPLAAVTLARPALGIVGVWGALAGWLVARAALTHRRLPALAPA